MEVNDLKAIWKKANDQEKSGYWVSREDMHALVRKKSRATIAEVMRELTRKVRISTAISILAALIGLMNILNPQNEGFISENLINDSVYGVLVLIMSACIMAISIHARFRRRQLSALETSAETLKRALISTKEIFGKIIQTGIWSDTVVTPSIIIGMAAFKVYQKSPFAFDMRLVYLIGVWVALGFAFHALAKFMMRRKFGRFIKNLDDRLQEFESLEE
ncbi:hypothetical protein BFP97_13335 [Roseivirga sp. 4D4]|uniref:hypothetical protein n=1 Tax=Roseivirga sp. 4D4 TaxID=1889784 RepID=UPI000853B66B|nr:hypothetical protein [Roseivirga sp. 4D4]OEK02443.1 hypothetical protein BFP97_13335 [Roseivirga sp. 4D4]